MLHGFVEIFIFDITDDEPQTIEFESGRIFLFVLAELESKMATAKNGDHFWVFLNV